MDGQARIEGLIRDFRANVVSFCGADDEAIHWLHYGRSGTGVAIGVDGCALQVEQFALCPVIYDQKEQDEYLFALLAHVDKLSERSRLASAVPTAHSSIKSART